MNRSETSRSFTMATWLGWQVESNWTDPFLFAIYVVIKPLATAAILVVMYSIITNGDYASPLFPYIYLGNAFYIYVGAVMTGVSWAVIDDREHYRTLKYMYIAPISIPFYWLGRGVSRFLIGTIAVVITIGVGALFFNLPLNLAEVNWGLFFVSLFIGVTMLAMIGLILASLTLMMAQQNFFVGEAVAGALYLFSGAIFPLEVLPAWIRPVGYAMPITYWLELMRRSLIGGVAQAFPTLAEFSNLQLLGILTGLTVLFGIVSVFTFRWCDHRARERGLIDHTTNY
ncbi:MAG: ABC transporter [Anaerolineae bacterium]|nr:MAG: ABC transporter [Anaerolineae bacterium]WKZ43990.1 MAG: ABC transporter permease [Anaerolineales bacterium]